MALQSELKKLQQVTTRGSGVPKAEWDNVCEAAYKAISLLQLGGGTSAKFTSHATGRRRQLVFEIFAIDADDNCKHVENETSVSDKESTGGGLGESTATQTTTSTMWKLPHSDTTPSTQQLHFEKNYRRPRVLCPRLDIRGITNRLRDRQLHDVMVHVGRQRDTI